MAATHHSLDALAIRGFLDGLEPDAAQALIASLQNSIPSLQASHQVQQHLGRLLEGPGA